MYVYIQSEKGLYTVGFYDPKGNWHPESDYSSTEEAAERVAFLNGGQKLPSSFLEALNSGDGSYHP